MNLKKLFRLLFLWMLIIVSIGSVVLIGGAAVIENMAPHPSERQEVKTYHPLTVERQPLIRK